MEKGFTLVELLAVIVVLSLLALLASTSVTKIVRDSKSDFYNTQIELIKVAAETWGSENLSELPGGGECKYLKLYDLKVYGLLESNLVNPKTNQEFSNNMYIKISSNFTDYGKLNPSYEVDATDIRACSPVYPSPCTLASDSEKTGTELGTKYTCEVKKGTSYNFYVLSNNEDGTTNLIMERNIYYDSTTDTSTLADSTNKGLVSWVSKSDYNDDKNYGSNGNYDKGPITAMNYIYNATKDWDNIPNMIMNYIDEGKTDTTGYGKIITENGITKMTKKDGSVVTVLKNETGYKNLKARLPMYDEIYGEGKCLGSVENVPQYGSCPLWLSNYLKNINYVAGEGLQNIDGIYGYWLLSSNPSYSNVAFTVNFYGWVYNYYVYSDGYYGVRPVITVKL